MERAEVPAYKGSFHVRSARQFKGTIKNIEMSGRFWAPMFFGTTPAVRFSPAMSAHIIQGAIAETLSLIEKTGVDTYDPFDVMGSWYGQKVITKRTGLTFLGRVPLWLGIRHAPVLTRRLLRVKKRATAGGVANLASAHIVLGGAENLKKAKRHLEWLLNRATKGPGYIGWGFPYPWLHKTYHAPGAPIGHTTMTVGNSFLRYHEATDEEWVIEPLVSLCQFFDKGLNKTHRSSGTVAVSYTPTDHTQVINVQADIASLLIRTGRRFNRVEFCDLALKLAACVVENQNDDGSWYYSAFDSIDKKSFIDNHHTGMVLSSLTEIHANLDESDSGRIRIELALAKGTRYFLEQLFTPSGLPKSYNDSTYPLDIYNFAQSIITLLDIQGEAMRDTELTERARAQLLMVVGQLLTKMYKPGGGFLYRRTRLWKQDLQSLRWADALICFALARYYHETVVSAKKPHESITRTAEIQVP